MYEGGIYGIRTSEPPFPPSPFFPSLDVTTVTGFLWSLPAFLVNGQIHGYVQLLLKYKR